MNTYIRLQYTQESIKQALNTLMDKRKGALKPPSYKEQAEELIHQFWNFSDIIQLKEMLKKIAQNKTIDNALQQELYDTIQFIEQIEASYRTALNTLTNLFQLAAHGKDVDAKLAYRAIHDLIQTTQASFFNNPSFIPADLPDAVKEALKNNTDYSNRYMQAYIDAKKAAFSNDDPTPEKITLHNIIVELIEKIPAENLCDNKNIQLDIQSSLFNHVAPKLDFIMQIKNIPPQERDHIIATLKNTIQYSLPASITQCLQEREKNMLLLELLPTLLQLYKNYLPQQNRDTQKQFQAIITQLDEKIKTVQTVFQENNNLLNQYLFDFCKNQGLIQISEELSKLPTIQNDDIQKVIQTGLDAEKLSWTAWFSTATFQSRLRNMVIGLASGGGVGAIATVPLLLVSPPVALAGAAMTGLSAAIAGFYSPEIKQSIENNAQLMMDQLQSFFITLPDEFEKEFPQGKIADKYQETDIMTRAFGVQAAKSIAVFYVNNLFEIQLKIRYDQSLSPEDQKNLKATYFHLLKNYQMIRGDAKEITNIYNNQSWGPDTAEAQIAKMKQLTADDRRAVLKNDVALFSTLVRQQAVERERHFFQAMVTIEEACNQPTITHSPELQEFKTHFGIEFSSSTTPAIPSKEADHRVALFQPRAYPIVEHKQENTTDSIILASNKEEDKVKSAFHEMVLYSNAQHSTQSSITALKRIAKYATELPKDTEKLPTLSIPLRTDESIHQVVKDYLSGDFNYFLYFIDRVLSKKNKEEIAILLSSSTASSPSLLKALAQDSVNGIHYFELLVETLQKNGIPFIEYCNIDIIKQSYLDGNVIFFNKCVEILKTQYDPLGMVADQKEKACSILQQILAVRASDTSQPGSLPPHYGALSYRLSDTIAHAANVSSSSSWGWALSSANTLDLKDVYFTLLTDMNQEAHDFNENLFIESVSDSTAYKQYHLLGALQQDSQHTLSFFNEKISQLDSPEKIDFISSVYNSPLPPEQKEIFFKTVCGTLSENDASAIASMIYHKNIKINGKNILWTAIEMGNPFLIPLLYKNASREAIDYAGPQGSAFTFSAKQADKDAYLHFCENSSKAWAAKGFTRFSKDETGKHSFHYIAETGTIEQIQAFLAIQGTYGGIASYIVETWGSIQFNTPDQNRNTPMSLILSRPDAVDIINVIQKTTYGYTLFDLDTKDKVTSNFSQPTVIQALEKKPEILLTMANHIIANQLSIPPEKRNQAFMQTLILSIETNNEKSLTHLLDNLPAFYANQNSWGYTNPLNALLPELLHTCLSKAKNNDSLLNIFFKGIRATFPPELLDLLNKREREKEKEKERATNPAPVLFRMPAGESVSSSQSHSPVSKKKEESSPKKERKGFK